MKFYKLSEQRVRRILNSPHRVEEGIAPNTIAMMQVAGSRKHPYEIWVMIQKRRQTRNERRTMRMESEFPRESVLSQHKSVIIKVISAWKYPGRTKAGESLPEAIAREINEAVKFS